MIETFEPVLYLVAVFSLYNLFACGLMAWDKRQAKRHAWRVPERTLFLVAATGGSLGVLMGMYLFRHKTRHLTFTLGIPAIVTAQIGAVWFFSR